MEDPIPAGFLALPEALQQVADCVSEAHVENAKLDFQANVHAIAQIRRGVGQSATATPASPKSEAADSETFTRPSHEALLHWDKRNFAVAKLTLALQTGAISAMVRSPESGGLFRLTPTDWHFEPFCEQIIRGGVIPLHATRGLEAHRGRTVLIKASDFEIWLTAEIQCWNDRPKEQLCYRWLLGEMSRSPTNKQKTKAQWFQQAKANFRVSGRRFDAAWCQALKETGSNWGGPGAPKKSSQ